MYSRDEFGNQTEFALEEPLFSPGGTPAPQEEVEKPVSEPWWKKKHLVIAVIVGVTLLVIFLLVIINMIITAGKRPQVPDAPEPSATPIGVGSPLLNRIDDIDARLKSADPNQPQFAFPAVDMSIRIDEKRQ